MEEKKKLILSVLGMFALVFGCCFILFMLAIACIQTNIPFVYTVSFSLFISVIFGLEFITKYRKREIDRLIEILIFKKIATYKSDDKYKEYVREIPNDYGPAVVSLLMDYELEYEKDIAATILNLHAKKYIQIPMNGKFEDIVIINDDTKNLLTHELYVFECIKSKSKIENYKFENFVKDDTYSLGLLENKRTFYEKNLIFLLIVIVISIIIYIYCEYFIQLDSMKSVILFSVMFNVFKISVVMFIIGYLNYLQKISARGYVRTSYGKEQANLWLRLKLFLTDFSQLDKSNLVQIDIWNSYLAYALGMGIIEKEDEFTKINPGSNLRYENIEF